MDIDGFKIAISCKYIRAGVEQLCAEIEPFGLYVEGPMFRPGWDENYHQALWLLEQNVRSVLYSRMLTAFGWRPNFVDIASSNWPFEQHAEQGYLYPNQDPFNDWMAACHGFMKSYPSADPYLTTCLFIPESFCGDNFQLLGGLCRVYAITIDRAAYNWWLRNGFFEKRDRCYYPDRGLLYFTVQKG